MKNSTLARTEYSDMLRRNMRKLILAPLAFVLVSVLCCLLLAIRSYSTQTCDLVTTYGYSKVVVAKTPYTQNSFYKQSNLNSVQADVESKRVTVNTYMQVPGMLYTPSCPMSDIALNKNEIAISKTIAESLRVKIGSPVYLNYVMADGPTMYTVGAIIEPISDFYRFEQNKDFSVVLLPYDENIVSTMRHDAVAFLENEEAENLLGSNFSYYEMLSIDPDIQKAQFIIRLTGLLHLAVLVAVAAIYSIRVATEINTEMIRYRYDSYELSFVRKSHSKLVALEVGLPLLMLNAFYFALYLAEYLSAVEIICYSVACFVVFVVSLRRNRPYA